MEKRICASEDCALLKQYKFFTHILWTSIINNNNNKYSCDTELSPLILLFFFLLNVEVHSGTQACDSTNFRVCFRSFLCVFLSTLQFSVFFRVPLFLLHSFLPFCWFRFCFVFFVSSFLFLLFQFLSFFPSSFLSNFPYVCFQPPQPKVSVLGFFCFPSSAQAATATEAAKTNANGKNSGHREKKSQNLRFLILWIKIEKSCTFECWKQFNSMSLWVLQVQKWNCLSI